MTTTGDLSHAGAATWLVSPAASPYLAAAAAETDMVARIGRLRRRLSPERAAAVSQLIEQRLRAREKFGAAANTMFFSERMLQQATDAAISAYKAARFPTGATLVDLCCGAGGDAISLATGRRLLAVDRDPAAAIFTDANARVLGVQLTACCGDVQSVRLQCADAWHIDPDRRPGGRRTTEAAFSEPNAATIAALVETNRAAAVKLAPAAELDEPWAADAEREWISRGGSCRQQVAWLGTLAQSPRARAATRLDDAGGVVDRFVGEPIALAPTNELGAYVWEPDGAVLASGLAGALAKETGAALITPRGGYGTADVPATRSLVTSFRVLATTSLRVKEVAAAARELGVRITAIKQRGLDVRPETWLRDLAKSARKYGVSGEEPAVLICLTLGRRRSAIIAQAAPAS